MKKMSLKIAQASLSRDEMRMITGGSGGSCNYVCRCGGHPPITVYDCVDPSAICHHVYGTGGHCSGSV